MTQSPAPHIFPNMTHVTRLSWIHVCYHLMGSAWSIGVIFDFSFSLNWCPNYPQNPLPFSLQLPLFLQIYGCYISSQLPWVPLDFQNSSSLSCGYTAFSFSPSLHASEPGGLQPWSCRRIRHDLVTKQQQPPSSEPLHMLFLLAWNIPHSALQFKRSARLFPPAEFWYPSLERLFFFRLNSLTEFLFLRHWLIVSSLHFYELMNAYLPHLFILFMRFSRQEYWTGLPSLLQWTLFLSEPSLWPPSILGSLPSMAHSFLWVMPLHHDKAVNNRIFPPIIRLKRAECSLFYPQCLVSPVRHSIYSWWVNE